MTRNPITNAFAAAGYIILVVLFINYGVRGSNTLIIPIAMLSLFTLSAAVMGYIFLLRPVTLYLDGKKKEAVALFAQTVAAFAAITVVILAATLLLNLK